MFCVDLKFQFLSCARHLISLQRATDNDILSAAAIVVEVQTTPRNILPAYDHTNPPHALPKSGDPLVQNPPPSVPQAANTNIPDTLPKPVDPPALSTSRSILRAIDLNTPGAFPKLVTARSPLNDPERNKSGPLDTQHKASLETLRSEVLNQLKQLRQSDFSEVSSYIELRQVLHLPVGAVIQQPETAPRRRRMSGIGAWHTHK